MEACKSSHSRSCKDSTLVTIRAASPALQESYCAVSSPDQITTDGQHEHQLLGPGPEAAECATSAKDCVKNPGHDSFIPVYQLTKKDLPEPYQDDEELFELIKVTADLTVRLRVCHTSSKRLNKDLYEVENGGSRTGSGCIYRVYPNIQCRRGSPDVAQAYGGQRSTDEAQAFGGQRPTDKAEALGVGQKSWKFDVLTAQHVVFNTEEAKKTKIDMFYNKDESRRDGGEMRTVVGGDVWHSADKSDRCRLSFTTCDAELGKTLERLICRQLQLLDILNDRYGPGMSSKFIWVVSHPHGLAKHVTFGEIKVRERLGRAYCHYSYSADTCAGSSGSAIWHIGCNKSPAWTVLSLGIYHGDDKHGVLDPVSDAQSIDDDQHQVVDLTSDAQSTEDDQYQVHCPTSEAQPTENDHYQVHCSTSENQSSEDEHYQVHCPTSEDKPPEDDKHQVHCPTSEDQSSEDDHYQVHCPTSEDQPTQDDHYQVHCPTSEDQSTEDEEYHVYVPKTQSSGEDKKHVRDFTPLFGPRNNDEHACCNSSEVQSIRYGEQMLVSDPSAQVSVKAEAECRTNPGHKKLIPVIELTKDHLPKYYQDNDHFLEFIRVTAGLTVRLRAYSTSSNMVGVGLSETNLGALLTGTGFISDVFPSNKPCHCSKCRDKPKCTRQTWMLPIKTSRCTEFDDENSRKIFADFYFDNEQCVKTIQGGEVDDRHHTTGDCWLWFTTCESDLVKQLKGLFNQRDRLANSLRERYSADMECNIVWIVSHPHGLSKHVTFGMIKESQGPESGGYQYRCQVDVCPGCNGAQVWGLHHMILSTQCQVHLPHHSIGGTKPGWNVGYI